MTVRELIGGRKDAHADALGGGGGEGGGAGVGGVGEGEGLEEGREGVRGRGGEKMASSSRGGVKEEKKFQDPLRVVVVNGRNEGREVECGGHEPEK